MTTTELVANLKRLGIRLQVRDDWLRYHPRSAVTPDLARHMKAHKGELLTILRAEADDSEPEVFGPDGWPLDSIDPDELNPCPECGTFELWQTLVGNWRCLRCDPPRSAIRLMKAAERIRRRHGLPSPPGVKEHLAELAAAVNRAIERPQGR